MSDINKRIEDLETRVAQLEKKHDTTKAAPKKRAPSEYNIFMKDKLKELKVQNPGLPQADLMKMGAAAWRSK